MTYDFKKFENDSLTLPRDIAWDNFAKFENVGDMVQGFIRDVFYRAEEGEFKAQRGITLEQPDGTLVNVTVKRIPFILAKTDNLRLGDPLTVVFEKEMEPKKKGYKGAKVFSFYGKNLEENKDNKTVAELDKEDRARQSEEGADIGEDEFDGLVPEESEK